MRKIRSRPHGYRHWITNHWTISHPGLHMSQPRVTTTASLKCDEILDQLGRSSALDPTTQRTPLYGYRDFSCASGNNATIGTYKVQLVHNLKRSPPSKQRVLPSMEQRVLNLLVQQTRPTKYKRTKRLSTTTPEANVRVITQDIKTYSHPTARLTWEEERVSGLGLNLKAIIPV
jgi:hypothetical protein